MKLCVFPNDPLKAYFEKGEIKERYFNPKNFFDEVHFITFTEKDVDETKVQKIVGNAQIIIHSVGEISIKNRKKYLESINCIVKNINPDVIRAYNPLLEGWFAAKCAKKLNIPLFVSLHTQYDNNRNIAKKTNLKKFLALKYTEKFLESYVLESADKITIVYKIIESYVKKHTKKNPEVLYNKVDYERFNHAKKIKELPISLILSVGNLTKIKNHKVMIDAMKNIDADLLIIGSGELYEELIGHIKKNNLENNIKIIKSVPHDIIQNYYKSAKIFALAYNTDIESLPMPVMEAMASGLPVVIPYPKERLSKELEGVAIFSEMNSKSFSENIRKILKDDDFREELSKRSLAKGKDFDLEKIESREVEIYKELIKRKNIQ